MSRRRDYLTFFANRRGRGEFIFAREGAGRLRWILPAILIAGLGGLAVWWFSRPDPTPDTSAIGVTTVPAILHPISTSTTGLPGTVALCPAGGGDVHWTTFKATAARTGCIDGPVITTPKILWAAKVGVQGWLNNPVVDHNTVYVGSAGNLELSADSGDGVYALDLATGTRRWFSPASADVNGVAVSDGVVVATGDEGLVWGLDADDGLALWTVNAGAPVFTNPLIVDGLAVVGTSAGTVLAIDMQTGQTQWQVGLQGAVRGGAAYDGESIYVVSEGLDAIALSPQGNVIWRQRLTGHAGEGQRLEAWAAPAVAGDYLVVSLRRFEVFGDPALVALDRQTGQAKWWAVDAAGIKPEWGAVRSSPAVVGDLLVYGEGYSNRLVALGIDDGRTRWAVEVGAFCYPHWPSPAVVSDQAILPRYDGGLYAVDLAEQTLAWSIYLGQQDLNGAFPVDFGPDFCRAEQRVGTSVNASPAVADNGVILVGSLEGYLYAVGDESW